MNNICTFINFDGKECKNLLNSEGDELLCNNCLKKEEGIQWMKQCIQDEGIVYPSQTCLYVFTRGLYKGKKCRQRVNLNDINKNHGLFARNVK